MSNKDILRLENVSKFYKSANNVALGIRKVNVSFKMGEFVLITGASGSGKSTLLNVLSGMTSYEEGVMYINGEDSSYFGHDEYEKYRKDYISCIFQNYNIIDSYTVYENIELALIARGIEKKDRKDIVIDVAKKVGVYKRLKNKVTKLSGGEKQRVAIARALVSDSPILVCDEITGNLDHDTSLEIIELLHSVSAGKLVLMVTHDPEEVMQYATRVISMHDGMIQNDKVLKEVSDDQGWQIKDTKPISKKEIFRLAGKSFKNTPKKSILLVLIILVATIFIGFACASIGASTSNREDLYVYRGSQTILDKRRIMIKKKNGTALSDADYTYFRSLENVKYVFDDEYALNKSVNGSYVDYDVDFYYYVSGYIFPIEMINQKELTGGSMPTLATEFVLETNESNYDSLKRALGKEISFNVDGLQLILTLKGYIINNECISPIIYASGDVYGIMEEISLAESKNVKFGYAYMSDTFVKGPSLPNNTIVGYTRYDEERDQNTVSLVWQTTYESGTINDVNITYKTMPSVSASLQDAGNSSYAYFTDDYSYFSIYAVSSDIYAQFDTGITYQTSLFVNNSSKVNSILTQLNEGNYIAINAYSTPENYSGDILNAILSVFLYVFCVVLTFIIYLLAHLSLKNVIYSERKDLLIMRSLGMNAHQVTAQIYIKLVGASIVTTILFISTSIALHFVYFPSYHVLYAISSMRVIEMVYTFLLMISMTFFLSRKFAKNIFNANIASKDKEDVLG